MCIKDPEQVANKWPGLAAKMNELCEFLRIEDPKSSEVGREANNKLVKEHVVGEMKLR